MLRKLDERGIGGFYESIMALMVVTVGVCLLTTSFTIISNRRDDDAASPDCDRIMDRLLSDPTIALSDRLLDAGRLAHLDLGSELMGDAVGVKIMIAYPDGEVEVHYQRGEWNGSDRCSRSEAVNVYFHQADVRPALLIVWVWP